MTIYGWFGPWLGLRPGVLTYVQFITSVGREQIQNVQAQQTTKHHIRCRPKQTTNAQDAHYKLTSLQIEVIQNIRHSIVTIFSE